MLGARYTNGKTSFRVWAPSRKDVRIRVPGHSRESIALDRDAVGYWSGTTSELRAGDEYLYLLDGTLERPDPASVSQPRGVHGPSAIPPQEDFAWTDSPWEGIELVDMIMYEVHIGCFTDDGTFTSAAERLGELAGHGINAIEIMPLAQFPGERNWGYDGVYPFAVQKSYGGAHGLKTFVDACHQHGMAVILDVVYNHFGPEGNYLRDFGPYFTDKYQTPWGEAVNFDGAWSNGVRNYFIENALYWLREYHIDGLRLDACHAIHDMSARPFLYDLSEAVDRFSERTGRKRILIAEDDRNDSRVVRPRHAYQGYGMDAQWADDFHHAVHAVLTGERVSYYKDFGDVAQIAKALTHSYVYTGNYSEFRHRDHGSETLDLPTSSFVFCTQNHDQVGNRMTGDRLSTLTDPEREKLAAALLLLSPGVPLLFMGQEYGERRPFLYFVDHGDPDLVNAVREGRKREFAEFHMEGEPPDAFSKETFERSKLSWDTGLEPHSSILAVYCILIGLRRESAALRGTARTQIEVFKLENEPVVVLVRKNEGQKIAALFHFSDTAAKIPLPVEGQWGIVLDTAEQKFGGPGAARPELLTQNEQIAMHPWSALILSREDTDSMPDLCRSAG